MFSRTLNKPVYTIREVLKVEPLTENQENPSREQ
jgi:hypothetical protein